MEYAIIDLNGKRGVMCNGSLVEVDTEYLDNIRKEEEEEE